MLAPSSGDVMVTFASAVGVTFTVGVGVTFTVGVGVTFTVGVGVTFTVGVGVTLKACWTGLPFRRTGTSGPGNSKDSLLPFIDVEHGVENRRSVLGLDRHGHVLIPRPR